MKNEHRQYRVQWGRDMDESYLDGARWTRLEDETILYENELLPPGTVIMRWHSRTSFAQDAKEPALPLLQEGARYRVSAACESTPLETLYVQFVFRNLRGRVIDRFLMRGGSGTFTYPEGAYEYDMELIQGGSASFHFDHITIMQVEDEPDNE